MVEISKCEERCFALRKIMGTYSRDVLVEADECSTQCPFYKPKTCEDWIRREDRENIWLIPPEEYFAQAVAKK